MENQLEKSLYHCVLRENIFPEHQQKDSYIKVHEHVYETDNWLMGTHILSCATDEHLIS